MKIKKALVLLLGGLIISSYAFAAPNLQSKMNLLGQFVLSKSCGEDLTGNQYKYYDGKYYVAKCGIQIAASDYLEMFEVGKSGSRYLKLQIPEQDWIYSFAVNGKYIAVGAQYKIFIYEKKSGKFLRMIDAKEASGFSKIILDNGKIIAINSCFTCSEPGIRATILDFKTGKLLKNKLFTGVAGWKLVAFGPRIIIDYLGGKFLVSDISRYRISVYDKNFKLTDVVSNPNAKWNNDALEKDLSRFNSKEMHAMFNSKKSQEWRNYTQMQMVQFLDKNTILAYYTVKGGDYLGNFDIWKNKNGKWILSEEKLANERAKTDNPILTWDNFISSFGNLYRVDNGRLFALRD
ncbi:MAG: hypothetical protein PHV24_09005, partial [Candidatus Kapabacteria bacterium]|nr:hypothetical protein [Candidatus Kapabacteria bacterium]